jgi:hypothetical protein
MFYIEDSKKERVSGEGSGTTDAGSFFFLQGTSANFHR